MIEIKYLEKGDSKNCLFFIHGFCSGPEDWDAQINFFSNKFSVIAPTLRGHDGKNTKERPMSIEQLSNDCVSIIKEKKFNKVILVGHSMGGLAAREYIQNSMHWLTGNHRVAKLVTSGTPHQGSNYSGFGGGSPQFSNMFIMNNSADEKFAINQMVYQDTAGAGNAPQRVDSVGKWTNTSSQITSIDITGGSATLSTSSFMKVWGSN